METISQQKQELTRIIESVNDPEVLEAVKDNLFTPLKLGFNDSAFSIRAKTLKK